MTGVECSHSGTVFILGAGFSRAASSHMLLTDELGQAVMSHVQLGGDPRIPPGGFANGTFESWLSCLADDQPFLTPQENLENNALFLKVSEAIAEVLGHDIQTVFADPWPDWLPAFLRAAHFQRSTLLTFNYDTLIEGAVATGLLYEWGATAPVFWAEVTQDVPAWPPRPGRWAAERAETFRLLKLHGSLNWYWSPGDETGTSVARRDLPGNFGEPRSYTEGDRRRELPGRVPFVVPPAASKSTYYRNPLLRDIWKQAREALQGAAQVVVVGYSLPPTDLTVVNMLSTLRGSEASVTVVDLRAADVAGRLMELGVPEERIACVDGRGGAPVERFVSDWVADIGVGVASRLRCVSGSDLEDPLLVVWGREAVSAVVGVTVGDASPLLVIGPLAQPPVAIGISETRRHTPLPTLANVLEQLSPGSALEVRLPDGSRQTVIDCDTARFTIGYGSGRWHVLYASGPAPRDGEPS